MYFTVIESIAYQIVANMRRYLFVCDIRIWPTVNVNKHQGGKLILNKESESTVNQGNLTDLRLSGQKQQIRVQMKLYFSKASPRKFISISNLRKICKI